jgi:hypothetical protein
MGIKAMTVGELRAALEAQDDDAVVVLVIEDGERTIDAYLDELHPEEAAGEVSLIGNAEEDDDEDDEADE